MNFKDKRYYARKTKEYLGIIATALMFDLFLVLMFLMNTAC